MSRGKSDGVYHGLPYVPNAEELIDKAFRRGARARRGKKRRTRRERAEADESMVVTTANILSDNLSHIVRAFPTLDSLPQPYRDLTDILVGTVELKKSLASVDWASSKIAELKKRAIPKLRGGGDTDSIRRATLGRMASVVEDIEPSLEKLREARTILRKVPQIGKDPTIVVAGYPNVGKSSFVSAITRAHPEVAPYPFTTKGLSIGHFIEHKIRYQVVDTPGLLDRPLFERNQIERQAIAVLTGAADVVLFMIDPTETCGYPTHSQLSLLSELRETLSVPLLVVATKRDIPAPMPPQCELELTVHDKESVEQLKKKLVEVVDEVRGRRAVMELLGEERLGDEMRGEDEEKAG